MGERHSKTNKRCVVVAGGTAAALFCLAGAPAGLAQNTPGSSAIRNPMAPPSASGGGDKVKVDEHMIVDLHVNDEDLSNVLQMLSIQSQKNIVTSRNVSAVVTANLYGVTFYEALDAILHVNGYGYIERGNFIYVYTLEELGQIEAAQRQRVWRVIRLNYLNGVDAAEFVKPLLSENGQIKTNGRAGAFSESGTLTGEDFANESTMLVHDFEENLAEIERVLKELDTRPSQVLIEATILQTALTEANAFGVDFSVLGDMDFGDFLNLGGPLKVVDAMIGGAQPTGNSGQGVVSTPGGTTGPSTFKLGIVSNDVAAFLRLLDEVSDTTILSRPNLLILNRSTGRVLVGRKVGYLSTTSTDTATTQTVEFLDTGTQLVVRPFIAADGMIRMELKPKVSEAVVRNTTTAGGQAVTIPDEISNELTTTVLVRDGHTIVLGGLFRESTQASRRQVPFAGDLPIIGAAFRGHDDEVQRSEVIFMITPTIMADNVLLEQGQRAEAAVDQVRAGSRQGLLPWSRDKRTQQMLVQAQELARAGDREGALYRVNRALRLNPYQSDAIALREQLMQERSNWPTRSIQHEIITGEIEGMMRRPQSVGEPGASLRRAPELNVEVDAGEGMAWFEESGDEPAQPPAPASEAPAKNSEQAAAPEPMAWGAPGGANAPAATPNNGSAGSGSASSASNTPGVQPWASASRASGGESGAAANQPASPASFNGDTAVNHASSSSFSQSQGTAGSTSGSTLRANPQPAPSAWSSALTAALEESHHDLSGEPAQAGSASTTSSTASSTSKASSNTASAIVKPGEEMVWDPQGGNSGGVFGGFATMWEMFNSYSARTTHQRAKSAVTSVPTEADRK